MPDEGFPKETHDMVVLGTNSRVYLSHLAKFIAPHDYQIILQAALSSPVYETNRHHYGTSALFTLRPEPLSVAELRVQAAVTPEALPARLFFGRVGRDGGELGEVRASLLQTLYFQQFDPLASHSSELRYIFFGGGDEGFLAHRITAPPDFDQILLVRPMGEDVPPGPPPGALLDFGGRENRLDDRLAPGEQASGAIVGNDGFPTQHETRLQVVAEVYLETEDFGK
ncbi:MULTISPECIES: hypothetical protein [Streptomyces]|uniref:Uncharacterized protein n=1 Tax=Streptomyces venezuelae (strain ATCC 10712 / CBS 650.69 / DSM 40230 / JCM 4526 / NBRC 13096 / PD 04745) TaxID=953739 RepID=F2RKD4_STRVP|nr:hypothetical protein [Streptomyces venezuelae]APE25634.1 hypothetical protein vnz_34510 [Streptomyces venezuelae]QES02972.1 hypothetical protein DEJ43_35080 [Streptomyces venezuelae ATCC 10712]CCA60290.1 hypothetical protein SVEN_7004 [Streptomyces venezuelae ATCC 10712]